MHAIHRWNICIYSTHCYWLVSLLSTQLWSLKHFSWIFLQLWPTRGLYWGIPPIKTRHLESYAGVNTYLLIVSNIFSLILFIWMWLLASIGEKTLKCYSLDEAMKWVSFCTNSKLFYDCVSKIKLNFPDQFFSNIIFNLKK